MTWFQEWRDWIEHRKQEREKAIRAWIAGEMKTFSHDPSIYNASQILEGVRHYERTGEIPYPSPMF